MRSLRAESDPDGRPLIGLVELMHAVLLAKKIIELVCSCLLAHAAQDYTLELNQVSRELGPKGTGRKAPCSSDCELGLRAEFTEAARSEMGYADEPLLRRMHISFLVRSVQTEEPQPRLMIAGM